MKIKDFTISRLMETNYIRHILPNKVVILKYADITLCGTIISKTLRTHIDLKYYFSIYGYNLDKINLCSECFNKLPKDIQDRIKFNYIVSKLKNED